MTEGEWLVSTDPQQMFAHCCGKKGWWRQLLSRWGNQAARRSLDRKCRLLACECCRQPPGEDCLEIRHALRTSEWYADGLVTEADLRQAHNEAYAWIYMI